MTTTSVIEISDMNNMIIAPLSSSSSPPSPSSALLLSEEKKHSHSTMMLLSCKNNDVVNESDSDTDQTTGETTDDDEDDINYDDEKDDDDNFDSASDSSVVTTTKNSNDDNDDNDNDNVSVKQKKIVSFGSVYIRQYERIVGDHPETKVGVPVSIGWKYYDSKEQYSSPISIYEYDEYRVSKGRGKYLLKMSSITRRNMLLNVFDIPEQELARAEKETKKIKKQRNRSNRQPILVAQITGYNKKIGNKIRNCGMSLLKGMSFAAQSGMMSGVSISSELRMA
jgi:hypothetical protein